MAGDGAGGGAAAAPAAGGGASATPWGTIWGGIIGGLMGIERHYEQRGAYKQDKAMAANTARYNHATNFEFENPDRPSHAKNVGGGIMAGMSGGQNMDPSGTYHKQNKVGSGDGGMALSQQDTEYARPQSNYGPASRSGDGTPEQRTQPSGSREGYTLDEWNQEIDKEDDRDKKRMMARQDPNGTWMRMG